MTKRWDENGRRKSGWAAQEDGRQMGTGRDEGVRRTGADAKDDGDGRGQDRAPAPAAQWQRRASARRDGERARGETASIASWCSVAGAGASRGDGGRRRVTVLGGTGRRQKTTTPPLSPMGEAGDAGDTQPRRRAELAGRRGGTTMLYL